jgi:hypothetical protein
MLRRTEPAIISKSVQELLGDVSFRDVVTALLPEVHADLNAQIVVCYPSANVSLRLHQERCEYAMSSPNISVVDVTPNVKVETFWSHGASHRRIEVMVVTKLASQVGLVVPPSAIAWRVAAFASWKNENKKLGVDLRVIPWIPIDVAKSVCAGLGVVDHFIKHVLQDLVVPAAEDETRREFRPISTVLVALVKERLLGYPDALANQVGQTICEAARL